MRALSIAATGMSAQALNVEVIAHIDTADEKRLVPEYRLDV